MSTVRKVPNERETDNHQVNWDFLVPLLILEQLIKEASQKAVKQARDSDVPPSTLERPLKTSTHSSTCLLATNRNQTEEGRM